jgi:serine/threonine protein phosphatase PrpC
VLGCIAAEGSSLLTSTVAIVHDNSAHGGDNHLVRTLSDHALLDAVMDGVTSRAGAQASQSLVDALAAAPLTSVDDVVAVLKDVNRRLYQIGRGRFLLTTVSAALWMDGKLFIVGAGDSPVYLIRSNAFQRWSNHVPGLLIGASEQLVNLHRTEVRIDPGDRLVLATDGVTDNMTSRELVEIVRSAASPDNAAEQISSMLASRRAQGRLPGPLAKGFRCDDWTVILRFFSSAGKLPKPINLSPPR